MSGFYGRVPGTNSEVFVRTDDVVPYGEVLSSLIENHRRTCATFPRAQTEAVEQMANHLADILAADPEIAALDRELVCKVALIFLSKSGSLFLFGLQPSMYLNVGALAAAIHGGHFAPEATS